MAAIVAGKTLPPKIRDMLESRGFGRLLGMAVLAIAVWFGSYAYVAIFQALPFKPLYSYLGLVVLAAAAGMAGVLRGFSLEKGVRALFVWLALYTVFGITAFANSMGGDEHIDALITLVETVFIAGSFSILFSWGVRENALCRVFGALSLVMAVTIVADFITPSLSRVPGRGAGIFLNPNIAGHVLALSMVAGVRGFPVNWRMAFILICGAGVFASFSRAGWVLWGAGVFGIGWYRVLFNGTLGTFTERGFGFVLGVGVLVALFSGSVGNLVMDTPVRNLLTANTAERLGVVMDTSLRDQLTANTAKRLGIQSDIFGDASAASRADLLTFSLEKARSAIWTGHGLGATDAWSREQGPHNMYLLFLVEGGIAGLSLYLGLLAVLAYWSHGLGRVIVGQLLLAGFVTHNILDFPVYLLFISLSLILHGLTRDRLNGGRTCLADRRRGARAEAASCGGVVEYSS